MSKSNLSVLQRITVSLCAIATLATVLALAGPRNRLAQDLEQASHERLERAAAASLALLHNAQQHLHEKHQSMSRTPEFRANLETADVPTLSTLAEILIEREQSIDAVVFTNSRGSRVAAAGEPELASQLLTMRYSPSKSVCAREKPNQNCLKVAGSLDPLLFASEGEMIIGTSVPLFIRDRFIGRVTYAERYDSTLLGEWPTLSGATVSLTEPDQPLGHSDRIVISVPPLELRVSNSFEAEREALDRMSAMMLIAGLCALAVAYGLSVPLARSLLGPLAEIKAAADRIRGGDRSTRLRSTRVDEFGKVARAIDTMLDHLETAQTSLERTQSIARIGGWSRSEGESDVAVSSQLRSILALEEEGERIPMASILARVHPDDRRAFERALQRCETQGFPFALDHRVLLSDGSDRILHTQGERVQEKDGSTRMEGIVQDVTERKQVEEQVRTLAYRDGLTGLGNRRFFAESLQSAVSLAQQNLTPLAVLFLDLDDFKVVNDTLGHTVGDQLLCVVADRLMDVVREIGDYSEDPTVHRLGGDEFAVILPQIDDWNVVAKCAQAIATGLSGSVDLDGYDVQASASIGIATWPDEALDVEGLLTGCDTAMYYAKREGRGQYRFYDPSMRAISERRLRMETRLRRAIEDGELEIVYQPKVEPRSGRVAGFEALLRWRDRDLGAVSPDEFVALAEKTGQILALGDWVLREVVRQAQVWLETGVTDVPISVNISSVQIETNTLVDAIVEALRETGLPPGHIEFEVTETALLRDKSHAIKVLRELKQVGIKLSLDDFGTGYSSLSYLRCLPIDAVKIDRSFILDIVESEQDRALVRSIITMAKVLGLEVVVEGVEEAAQCDLLADMECDLIQGFLYSEGVSAERVPEVLNRIENGE
ncbi:MAG: EAL domain-containing protein [Deltaproteobacteria bacterium]|nr:EAL domain-containing protein [Deltaproteobacteria bacterium]